LVADHRVGDLVGAAGQGADDHSAGFAALAQAVGVAAGGATSLRERGKPGGIVACALAHRANKIAYAMVRDQKPYDPTRWA